MKNKIIISLILIMIVIILCIISFNKISYFHGSVIVEKRDFHESNYSEQKIDTSNLIILVSNQSFDNGKVNIKGFIDTEELFNNNFKVGNQHVVSYYYSNLPSGEHLLVVESEDGAKISEDINIGNEKVWVYITYWFDEDTGPKIRFQKQNKPFGLD